MAVYTLPKWIWCHDVLSYCYFVKIIFTNLYIYTQGMNFSFFLHAGLLIWGCGRASAYNTAFLLDICSLLQELRPGWPWRRGEARAHLAPAVFRLWTLNSHAVWNVLLWRFILIPMCLHSLRMSGNEATHEVGHYLLSFSCSESQVHPHFKP